MLTVSDTFKQAMVAPVRSFAAEAEVRLNADNMGEVSYFTHNDAIKTIEIQRVGDNSKFFGFGICQRLNMRIVDLNDSQAPVSGSDIKVRLGIRLPNEDIEYISFPTFKITERNREEEEGQLSIIAYDKLNDAGNYTVSQLGIQPPYTIKSFIQKCAEFLGVGCVFENITDRKSVV